MHRLVLVRGVSLSLRRQTGSLGQKLSHDCCQLVIPEALVLQLFRIRAANRVVQRLGGGRVERIDPVEVRPDREQYPTVNIPVRPWKPVNKTRCQSSNCPYERKSKLTSGSSRTPPSGACAIQPPPPYPAAREAGPCSRCVARPGTWRFPDRYPSSPRASPRPRRD